MLTLLKGLFTCSHLNVKLPFFYTEKHRCQNVLWRSLHNLTLPQHISLSVNVAGFGRELLECSWPAGNSFFRASYFQVVCHSHDRASIVFLFDHDLLGQSLC